MCPGERPVSIVSNRTITDDKEGTGDIFPKISFPSIFGLARGLMSGDPTSAIEGIMKDMGVTPGGDSWSGQFGGNNRGALPPHARINNDEALERLFGNKQKVDDNLKHYRGEIAGDIEEI